MSLALSLQVLSQAPQHFRFFKCKPLVVFAFSRQCICSIISLDPGLPTTVYTQESSKVDADSPDLNVRTTRPQHPRYRPRIDCKLSKRKKGKNEEKLKKRLRRVG